MIDRVKDRLEGKSVDTNDQKPSDTASEIPFKKKYGVFIGAVEAVLRLSEPYYEKILLLTQVIEFKYPRRVHGDDRYTKRNESVAEIEAILLASGFDKEIADQVGNALLAHYRRSAEPPPLPVEAPILWTNGREDKESPASFIKRVYAPWIGKNLTRSTLLKLDKQLYSALGVWMQRGGSLDFELPTKKELNNRWLDRVQSTGIASGEASKFVTLKHRRKHENSL